MQSKYYTPDISEFYVGFEYQTSYLQDYDTWKTEILEKDDAGYFHSIYYGDAVEKEFRVKYLDREDIESLGFKLINSNWYHNGNYQILGDYRSLEISKGTHEYRKILFEGSVKNKSELKKLLKQLNIDYEQTNTQTS